MPQLGPCWVWTANTVRGYGQFVLPRRPDGRQPHIYAHRFSYELEYGPISSTDLKACHRCDNPLCVRPDHLFLGSQARNLDDARRKGRLVDGAHLIKVSDDAIADIQAHYVPRRNGNQLAAKYGIHLITVLRIAKGTHRVLRQPRPVFERVPFRLLPVIGTVHTAESGRIVFDPQLNTTVGVS